MPRTRWNRAGREEVPGALSATLHTSYRTIVTVVKTLFLASQINPANRRDYASPSRFLREPPFQPRAHFVVDRHGKAPSRGRLVKRVQGAESPVEVVERDLLPIKPPIGDIVTG